MYEQLPLGAHLVTPRRGYTHHGIYVGQGKVVHYAGCSRFLNRGPVEELALERFTRGRGFCIQFCPHPQFDAHEVVRRARSRLGENCYRLLSNNCEHFCEWCLCGESRSEQVEKWLLPLRPVLRTAGERLAQFLDPRPAAPQAGAIAV